MCMLVGGGDTLLDSWQSYLCDSANRVVQFITVVLGSWENSSGQCRNTVHLSLISNGLSTHSVK